MNNAVKKAAKPGKILQQKAPGEFRRKKTGQNFEINILKLLFAGIVVLYHYTLNYNFGLTYAGYIAADYFFILSGIFLHRKIVRSGWKVNPLRYTGKRYLQFLPWTLFAFAASVFIRALQEGSFSILKLFTWTRDAGWQLLALYCFGLKPAWDFDPPLWYNSSLIFADLLLLVCYWFLGKRFDKVTPVIAIVIYGYFFVTLGHIRAEGDMMFLVTKGTYRGIAGLCLGITADQCTQQIRKKTLRPWLMRTAAWVLIVYSLYGHRLYPTTRRDFWFLGVMTVAFVLILSLDEPEKLRESPVIQWISRVSGELSLSVYFNHNYLMGLSCWSRIRDPLIRAAALCAAVLAVSLLAMAVIDGMKRIVKAAHRTYEQRSIQGKP